MHVRCEKAIISKTNVGEPKYLQDASSTKAETGSMHQVCRSILQIVYKAMYRGELLCSLLILLCIPLYDSMFFFLLNTNAKKGLVSFNRHLLFNTFSE
jgi:hypothetical protein